MTHIKTFAAICVLATTAGCMSVSPALIRFDQRPGQSVDLTALQMSPPLCLKSDPQSLQFTAEFIGDGLRKVVWTRPDGTQRSGVWYASKSVSIVDVTPRDVTIHLDWPTVKDNGLLKFAATMVFMDKLVEDEDTPSEIINLTDLAPCSQLEVPTR